MPGFARPALRSLVLLPLAAFADPAAAAVYRVGTGSGCTHSSIQAAVNAAGSATEADTIRITESLRYSQQRVLIRGKSRLTLEGGYATCQSSASSGVRTIVDGAGGLAASVFWIENSSVTLRHLNIIGGDSFDFGGGITFAGSGGVGLENTRVGQNSALDGGGIAVIGGSTTTLAIGTDSTVEVNTARRDGGGIYCRGAQVFLTGQRSRVVGNRAVNGGGIAGVDCRVRASTNSRYGDGGTIYSNAASGAGGGVHLVGSDLLMWTTDPFLPLGITGNSSVGFGGGLYLVDSSAEIVEGIVDGNRSQAGGGAAFVQSRQAAAELAFTRDTGGLPGAVPCASAMSCNRVTNNVARSAAGMNQHGAAVMLYGDAADVTVRPQPLTVDFANATVAGNQGHTLVRTVIGNQADPYVRFSDTEVRGNTAGGNLVELVAPPFATDPARVALSFWRSTLAANTIGGTSALYSQRNVSISHAIVWQPARRVLTTTGVVDATPVNYSIVSDTAGFGASPTVLVADPRFVDAANGNLRPSWSSPAIDFAPASGARARDGTARTIDLPSFWNRYGAQDVGAFEVATDPGSVICCATIAGG